MREQLSDSMVPSSSHLVNGNKFKGEFNAQDIMA